MKPGHEKKTEKEEDGKTKTKRWKQTKMERQKQNIEKQQSIIINETETNKNQQPKGVKARQNS